MHFVSNITRVGEKCCNPMSISEFEGNRVHKKGSVEKFSKKLVAENQGFFIYFVFMRTLKSKITKFASFWVLPQKVLALPFL